MARYQNVRLFLRYYSVPGGEVKSTGIQRLALSPSSIKKQRRKGNNYNDLGTSSHDDIPVYIPRASNGDIFKTCAACYTYGV
jgi:hypothetical protein